MDELGPIGIQELGDGAWGIPAMGIIIRLKPLGAYTQNPNNPVQHSPRNFGTVLQSIQKLGALRSGFSSHGKILGGNLTYEAMTEAGIEWVVEVESEGKAWLVHERPDLTEEQQQLAAYFDQQSAMQATWNVEQIASDIESGLPLTDGPFYDNELQDFVLEAERQVLIENADIIAEPVSPVDDGSVLFLFGEYQSPVKRPLYELFAQVVRKAGGVELALGFWLEE